MGACNGGGRDAKHRRRGTACLRNSLPHSRRCNYAFHRAAFAHLLLTLYCTVAECAYCIISSTSQAVGFRQCMKGCGMAIPNVSWYVQVEVSTRVVRICSPRLVNSFCMEFVPYQYRNRHLPLRAIRLKA